MSLKTIGIFLLAYLIMYLFNSLFIGKFRSYRYYLTRKSKFNHDFMFNELVFQNIFNEIKTQYKVLYETPKIIIFKKGIMSHTVIIKLEIFVDKSKMRMDTFKGSRYANVAREHLAMIKKIEENKAVDL